MLKHIALLIVLNCCFVFSVSADTDRECSIQELGNGSFKSHYVYVFNGLFPLPTDYVLRLDKSYSEAEGVNLTYSAIYPVKWAALSRAAKAQWLGKPISEVKVITNEKIAEPFHEQYVVLDECKTSAGLIVKTYTLAQSKLKDFSVRMVRITMPGSKSVIEIMTDVPLFWVSVASQFKVNWVEAATVSSEH